jgi:Fur family peroxide stress response transcriptional regulator
MQRFSKKRQAVYDCLCGTTTHPTADWIYQQLHPTYPDLSLGTVYRNLSQLKEAGLICSVGSVKGQERFDGNVSPHAHLICQGCGAVVDVMDVKPPKSLISAAQTSTGCLVTGMELRFTGLCPNCAKNSLS